MPRSGTALVALAAFFWGLSGGIAAVLMADGWSAYVVAFYRGAIGLVLVFAWLLIQRRDSGLGDPRFWFWSALAGLGVAGNFTFYFLSIAESSVAVAATLMYTAPVFVYLVSFVLRLEQVTAGKLAAIGLVMAGVVLLTQVYQLDAGAVSVVGVTAGLLSAVSYAVFIFGFGNAGRRGSPQAALTIALGVLVLVLFVPSDVGRLENALVSDAWPLFLALGVFGAGISFMLYIVGLKTTTPTLASIVAMVEPVTAALFGVIALGESLAIPQLLGVALILVTVTVLSARTPSTRVTDEVR